MAKKYSKKFWIIFWLVSIILLVVFYYALEFQKKGFSGVADNLPISQEMKTATAVGEYLLKNDEQERTFLLLFQNNMEIRPGGGFIGAFGKLKIKNGELSNFEVHDTGNFDARIPDLVPAPDPIKENMKVEFMKLRDSNFSPDFKENAEKAEYFYQLGEGLEKFDGVIGITTNVLTSFLKATGPVSLPDYPGTYGDENAVMQLEYQVEKGFDEQGISRGERKSVINELGQAVLEKALALDKKGKLELLKIILEDLERKDILLYFKDQSIQEKIDAINWSGRVDSEWKKDFLMLVDANIGAWKSDYFIKRSVEYTVDLSQEIPRAHLKINYNHTASEKNWLTRDYLSYLRVYAPEKNWLYKTENFVEPKFKKEFGKKSFESYVYVITGQTKVVELFFDLPKELAENYELKIQKQVGVNDVPWKVKIIQKDGNENNFEFILNSDVILK